MHEMVFEKSTATSGVSARVCIKRKSRSSPPPPPASPSDPPILISYLPSGFSIRDIFSADSAWPRAGRACFAFHSFNFASTIFQRSSFFRPLGYVLRRTNFERLYNACILRRASQCRITSANTSFPVVTRASRCQLIWQAICGWNRIQIRRNGA